MISNNNKWNFNISFKYSVSICFLPMGSRKTMIVASRKNVLLSYENDFSILCDREGASGIFIYTSQANGAEADERRWYKEQDAVWAHFLL